MEKNDFIVRVDRSIRPVYPQFTRRVLNPELELGGPAEYNLREVEQWLHDGQENGDVKGKNIYNYLKNNNTLTSCLNLQDGLAIQAKGVDVFCKLFPYRGLCLWGSVVVVRHGYRRVPLLFNYGSVVGLNWLPLNGYWDPLYYALRFSK